MAFILLQRAPHWYQHFQKQGKKSESFSVINLNGESVLLPRSDEKNTILIFWATWCGVCHTEMARFQEAILEGKLPRERILAISLGEPLQTVKEFAQKEGYQFSVFADPGGKSGNFFNVYA